MINISPNQLLTIQAFLTLSGQSFGSIEALFLDKNEGVFKFSLNSKVYEVVASSYAYQEKLEPVYDSGSEFVIIEK